ncbi:TonB-dependent receptor SusC [Chryseobacterium aquaeductus]|uniref:TonB-dependent receptor SusC n=1 Tax=Chryseobacterium aquaeductus TaxID=2675056 RepID=A0A9N8MES4_9FLAO|nr:SusC/RagA family TonB-linked outer membrane protein [Chryseobacterium aquaeductus]CAA7330466.1 TonB-dependent receptor SusC [Chryseobacterium potabilaquae]CAD7803832.1 TonB-dependent receptor SusC [Chryseobacterium aquaeductus]
MNVKLRVLTAGVLFFTGQLAFAQKTDTIDVKTEEIEEVVVLGYSKTITKKNSTVASNTVSDVFLENRPNANVLTALQGSAPGVIMNGGSGSPGSAKFSLLIRGTSSINGNTDALIVIDDVPSNASEYRNLNPNDIESMTVLKDAAATAIYGNRGANGVVVIRTKRGKFNSALKVSYTGMTGLSLRPLDKYNLSNTNEYLEIMRAYGLTPSTNPATPNAYDIALRGQAAGVDTDWKKVFFKPEMFQSHDVAISSGGGNVSSYSSFGYMEQGGAVPTTDFKRFTARSNIQARSKDEKLTVNSQIGLAFSRRNELFEETSTAIRNNSVQNPLLGVLQGLPYLAPGVYANGQELFNTIGTNFNNGNNIYVLENLLTRGNLPNFVDQISITGNLGASYQFTKNFSINNKFGLDYRQGERTSGRAPWSYLALATQGTAAFTGSESQATTRDLSINNVVSASYNGQAGEHTVDATISMEYNKVHYRTSSRTQNGLDPRTYVPGSGTGYVPFQNPNFLPSVGASRLVAGTLAYFANANYDYAGKYGFSGTLRRDASYRFVGDNQWATYWAVAGRWNIDQENFMEGSTFSVLKLRASYGTNGNQNIIAAGAGANPLLTATSIVRDQYTTPTGYGNALGSGFGYGNPRVQWEDVAQANIGLDFTLLGNKLEGTFDVYNKKTTNLFSTIPVSGVAGTYGINGNNGTMTNKGIELGLRYNILNKEGAKLTIFANGAYNQNRINEFITNGDPAPGTTTTIAGHQLYEWYAYKYAGVNKSNGNLLFYTQDGGVTENPNVSDAQYLDVSIVPKYAGSFGFESGYKGFFLDALFTFQQGIKKFDNALYWLANPEGLGSNAVGSANLSTDLLDAWSPTNTDSDVPNLRATNWGFTADSDYFIKDASFLKIRSVTVGYQLSKSMLRDLPITGMRVYVQAENIYTWTKWRGFDPEPITGSSLSIYPNPRMFTLGVKVDF